MAVRRVGSRAGQLVGQKAGSWAVCWAVPKVYWKVVPRVLPRAGCWVSPSVDHLGYSRAAWLVGPMADSTVALTAATTADQSDRY